MSEIPVIGGDVDVSVVRNQVTVIEEPTEVLVSVLGLQGARGSTFISGEGPPNPEDGIKADIYIDTVRNAFWGPKTDDGWGDEPFYVASNISRHVHTQQVASSEWIINHLLGGRPSVTVVDSAATTVIGEVSYVSNSQVIVRFTSPFSGFAYLT